MNNNKNLILAFALSAAVLLGWQYFVAMPQMRAEQAHQAALAHQEKTTATQAAPGAANLGLPQRRFGRMHMTREAALKAGGARIAIDTPMVDGSIALKGARLDDLRLKKYRETPLDPKSPEIVLLQRPRAPTIPTTPPSAGSATNLRAMFLVIRRYGHRPATARCRPVIR